MRNASASLSSDPSFSKGEPTLGGCPILGDHLKHVGAFKNGSAPHINNIELGRYGRYRTNVWDYAGVNSFRRG